jgi:aminopeptidase N
MKKLTSTYLILIFACSITMAQTGAEQCSQAKILAFNSLKKISQIQYPGDTNIDVTYYKLNLSINYSASTISGVVTVDAKPVQGPLSSFFLDLVNQLQVTLVKMNGGSNLTFSQPSGSDQLKINLDRTYATGEKFSVDIYYQGTPGTRGFGSFNFSTHNSQPIVWTLSEPYGAKDWWPSKDTPGDKADSSDVWITAPSSFVSVSNGKLIAEITNGDGTKTYKWKNSYPIAGYLISLAMTNYSLYQNQFTYSGTTMPVTHYVYPENLTTSNKSYLDNTVTALQIFSDKFGPYPFLREKYGHAQFGWGGGMEHQTCTSLVSFGEMLIVHELCHQWYGDKVTCKDWQNIWLNEGFATYGECVYQEAKYGTSNYKSYVSSLMSTAKGASGTIYVQDISNENQIFNTARTYDKGGVVLHMLRGVVGDDVFFQIMKQYASEPGLAYGVAATEDFQRVAERIYGQSLNYFFQEWIYGVSYPKYTFGWNTQQVSGNTYNLHLNIKQNTNTNPVFFTMPIQIKYVTPLETKTITIINNTQNQGWNISVNGQPTSVTFDPDNWIMKDYTLTSIDNTDQIPVSFSLAQNYPNPFNPSTIISYQLPIGNHVTLKVYDILGKEVAALVDEYKSAGFYSSRFSILDSQLSSGIYLYTLKAGDFKETKKMILLK